MNAPAKIEAGRLTANANTAPALLKIIEDGAKHLEYPVKVTVEGTGSTLDYKALLHIWFRAIAEQFTARDKSGQTYTETDMHDLMCHQFLGYTKGRQIGSKTQLKPALVTITYPTQKSRGELYDFCRQIEEWCQRVGVTLPENDSQYSQDKAKETA